MSKFSVSTFSCDKSLKAQINISIMIIPNWTQYNIVLLLSIVLSFQTLNAISTEQSSTIVFPFPIDTLCISMDPDKKEKEKEKLKLKKEKKDDKKEI